MFALIDIKSDQKQKKNDFSFKYLMTYWDQWGGRYSFVSHVIKLLKAVHKRLFSFLRLNQLWQLEICSVFGIKRTVRSVNLNFYKCWKFLTVVTCLLPTFVRFSQHLYGSVNLCMSHSWFSIFDFLFGKKTENYFFNA